MKLASKLVFAVVATIAIFLIIDTYSLVYRETELLESDIRTDSIARGKFISSTISELCLTRDSEDVATILQRLPSQNTAGFRWHWYKGVPDGLARSTLSTEALASLEHGEVVFIEEEASEELISLIPIKDLCGQEGVLRLAESLQPLKRTESLAVRRILILAALIALTSGLVISILGARMVGKPLSRLTEHARRIGGGDLSGRVDLRRSDELGVLADAMNQMCGQLLEAREEIRTAAEARIAALANLRHQDRLHTVGRLASGIAHELGTPLNVVSGRASLIISEDLSVPECRENAEIIKDQTKKMTRSIRRLLDFARRQTPSKSPTDLTELARTTADLLDPLARKSGSIVSLSFGERSITANVDAAQIQQVLSNLIVNALQSMSRSGRVLVKVDRVSSISSKGQGGARPCVRLSVTDEGNGIPETDLPSLFEPFFTTKKRGVGTGLGLSIAHGIVEEHGGWISVQSELQVGSTFSVYLPEGDNDARSSFGRR
jgi:signal transduction histidine kinase